MPFLTRLPDAAALFRPGEVVDVKEVHLGLGGEIENREGGEVGGLGKVQATAVTVGWVVGDQRDVRKVLFFFFWLVLKNRYVVHPRLTVYATFF